MGTNKSRNGVDSGTNKSRGNYTIDLRWQDANFDWDSDAADQTWDNAKGPGTGTIVGTNKSRNSADSGTNKTRN